MSKISDELRNWCESEDGTECGGFVTKASFNKILALADRIDAEMVELPKDADGVPIHVGDVMEWPYGNGEFIVEGIGGNTLFYIDKDSNECEWTAAGDKRHHHAPTVEDVLQEFTDEVWNRCCEGATASDSGIDELVAEYAAKLRLAGENA